MSALVSMQTVLLTIFYCMSMILNCNPHQFNLYQTHHRLNSFTGDCLYYYISEYGTVPQFIEYCIRSSVDQIESAKSPNYDRSFTFEELHEQHIDSYQLYTWSAPIDLIEQYQMYLDHNLSRSDLIFYNCTFPWFGTHCEYSFDKDRSHLSFVEQVEFVFAMKGVVDWYWHYPDSFPCYTHISCDRAGDDGKVSGACLDWREVCDGRINCLNSEKDEESCWQLEINECDPQTEFRCRNGQCIPLSFLNDDRHNPDCLDRTDEYFYPSFAVLNGDNRLVIPSMCYTVPAFKCEEHTRRWSDTSIDMLECADGFHKEEAYPYCKNKRDEVLTQAMMAGANLSRECHSAFECFMGFKKIYPGFMRRFSVDCNLNNDQYAIIIKQACPTFIELAPIIFGVVRFVYRNNVSQVNQDESGTVLPDYVCFKEDLCEDGLLSSLLQYTPVDLFRNNSTCVAIHNLREHHQFQRWTQLIGVMYALFGKCSMPYQPALMANLSHLYRCVNSSKMISQHRLKDGLVDCPYGDDESYKESCSLNDTEHRFRCTDQHNNIVCLAHVTVGDQNIDCADESDEKDLSTADSSRTKISFQTMCDGFTELLPVLINQRNETDETECSAFPCNNSYTRCDGIWNCLDGADEVNCEWPSLCPLFHHMCVSILTNNLLCLPIERANDGIIDCYGSYDERQFCRETALDPWHTYRCENSDTCISPFSACQEQSLCPSSSSVSHLCNMTDFIDGSECYFLDNLTHLEQLVCFLSDLTKQSTLHLSLTVNTSSKWRFGFSSNKPDNHKPLERWKNVTKPDVSMVWRCNRGLPINRWNESINNSQPFCFCPPAYYGDLCQYENQRVSLTLQTRVIADWRTLFTIVITLRDDEHGLIESSYQLNYISTHHCENKSNIYLLYGSRPKNNSTNYSVRMDVYNRQTLEYRVSWLFPILFAFLPVYRLAVQIKIPMMRKNSEDNCRSLNCGIHGHCFTYENIARSFCHCDRGWQGVFCQLPYLSNCSLNAFPVAPSICLCPVGQFGRFCHLKYLTCHCENGGSCLLIDERMDLNNKFICICPEGFSGSKCEKNDTQIVIHFAPAIKIPKSILIHLIEILGTGKEHTHSTVFEKIEIYEEMVTVFRSRPFHIVVVEIEDQNYYCILIQEKYLPSISQSLTVHQSHRCLHIGQLFNDTFSQMPLLRRVRFYHLPCYHPSNLVCFYDEIHMCICNSDLQQSNCFLFEHNNTFNCQGNNICENDGQCFEDYQKCPTSSVCICDDCSYGSRCQFSTKGYEISLEAILGYHIQPNVPLSKQKRIVKITISITSVILVIAFLNNILSILTFQSKQARESSCGMYLLISSLIAMMTMVVLAVKIYILIAAQMSSITNRNYLLFNCMMIDFVIKFLLNDIDWLNACVSVERAFITFYDVKFDQRKHRRTVKWVVISLSIFTILTNIQDPIFRRLIEDEADHRIWCAVQYAPSVRVFNSVMLFVHLLGPFFLNLGSACFIIHKLARHQSHIHRQKIYRQQLREQVHKLKHILIGPMIFILLSFPRLIISFLPGCLKSNRNPWLFLLAYYTSFIPPVFIFILFVFFSDTYKKDFTKTINRIQRRINSVWTRN